jgi:hypothetical protein
LRAAAVAAVVITVPDNHQRRAALLTSPIGGRDSTDSLSRSGEQTTHEQPRAIVTVNHGRFIFMPTMRAGDAHQVYRASSGVGEGKSHFSVPGMWTSANLHNDARVMSPV